MNADTQRSVSRRTLLKGGAVVGGVGVWAIPVVQALSMTQAHADTPSSGGHTSAPPPPPHSSSHGIEGVSSHRVNPPATSATAAPAQADGGGSPLAATGPALPIADGVKLGVGAIAAGAVAVAAGAYRRPGGRHVDPDSPARAH